MTTSTEIAATLGGEITAQFEVNGVSAAHDPRPHTIAFVSRWASKSAASLADHPDTMFLIPADAPGSHPNGCKVPNPRLAYALVLRDVMPAPIDRVVQHTASVSASAQIGRDVTIGHFAVIEDGVVVGDQSRIDHHVVLKSGVVVGADSSIGSHTSIGGPGFGFELDHDGTPVRLGHRGGVVIGDHVEIGHHCSIAQGTIEPTRIDDHVKIDDCVFLAHNVHVGEAAYIIAGAEVSGSVTIGARAWISPEVTIINKVTIGEDALVGIGAVVVSNVEPNTIVAGVPAKPRGHRFDR